VSHNRDALKIVTPSQVELMAAATRFREPRLKRESDEPRHVWNTLIGAGDRGMRLPSDLGGAQICGSACPQPHLHILSAWRTAKLFRLFRLPDGASRRP
jgi:hypothetical protein